MPKRSSRALLATAMFALLWAAMIGFIYSRASTEGTPYAELAAIAFGGAYGAVALGALMATLRHHPALLVATGVAMSLMALLGFSPVTLPLVIPGALLVALGANRLSDPRTPTLVGMAAVVALGVGALLALMLHQDPAEWRTATGGAGTSDLVTRTESLISLVISASVVVLSVAWTARRSPPQTR